MQRSHRWLAVFLVATAAVAAAHGSTPFLTVVELLRNPAQYNRQVVVLAGWLHSGREVLTVHGSTRSDDPQSQHIWIEDIEYVKANETRWPAMKRDRATQEPPLDSAGQQMYRKLFAGKWPRSTYVVLKGEFQTANDGQFGHLSAFQHRLIVYEVICKENR